MTKEASSSSNAAKWGANCVTGKVRITQNSHRLSTLRADESAVFQSRASSISGASLHCPQSHLQFPPPLGTAGPTRAATLLPEPAPQAHRTCSWCALSSARLRQCAVSSARQIVLMRRGRVQRVGQARHIVFFGLVWFGWSRAYSVMCVVTCHVARHGACHVRVCQIGAFYSVGDHSVKPCRVRFAANILFQSEISLL
jgi:hypothetical protein